jgi:cytochrome b involved in lipid metabolism
MNFTSEEDGKIVPKVKIPRDGEKNLPRSAGIASSSSSTGNSRGKAKKVKLGPGFSQMDWIRLNSRAKDMAGLGNKTPSDVSRAELRKHRSQYDCWMVLHGKVYNVTKYIPYHPGGFDEIMRGAGIDGTKLFDDNHSWVSIDGFLEKCYVGDFVDEGNEVNTNEVSNEKETKKVDENVVVNNDDKQDDDSVGGMSWDDLDGLL